MDSLWTKIKVWTKVGLLVAIVIYLLAFIFKNLSNTGTFWWWFGYDSTVSVLVLVLVAFIAGAVSMLLFRTAMKTFKQVREMLQKSRHARLERDVADMKQKAGRLQTREGIVEPPQHFPPPPAAS